MTDDLITGPVTGWRLMGGGIFDFDEPRLFARFAPVAIAHFLGDQTARDFSHRAWDWVTSVAEPLQSVCLVNDAHTETPAADCGCGYRLCTDFDDMVAYLRRMAGVGDHFVLARVETVGTLRASHARAGADPDGPLDDPTSTVRAEAIRVTDLFLHQDTHGKDAYGSPAAWLEQFGNAKVHVPPTGEPFTLDRWIAWVADESGDDFDQAAAMAYLADAGVSHETPAPQTSPDACQFCGDDECECDPDRPGWRFFGAFMGGTSRRPVLLSWDLLLLAHHGLIPDGDLDYHHTGEMVARCVARDHPAPDSACECGYRMVDDLGRLHRYAARHHFTGGPGERGRVRKLEGLIAVARVQGGGTVYGPAFGDPRGTLRFERLTVTHLFLSQQVYARPDLYGTAKQWREGFPGVEVHAPPPPRALAYNGREYLSPAQWFAWIESEETTDF